MTDPFLALVLLIAFLGVFALAYQLGYAHGRLREIDGSTRGRRSGRSTTRPR